MTLMRPLPRRTARTAAARRERALGEQIAAMIAPDATATLVRARPWASATFAGVRLSYRLSAPVPKADADRFAAAIGAHEFVTVGAFVAEARIADRRDGPNGAALFAELLVIDDA